MVLLAGSTKVSHFLKYATLKPGEIHEPSKCNTFGFNLNIKCVTIFGILESEAL